MKYLTYLLLGIIIFSCGNVDEVVDSNENERPWSFEEIERFVLEEFPEAYKQFLEISYYRSSGKVYPRNVTFLIPTRYFSEGKLTQKICDDRTSKVIKKIGGEPGNCESFTIGDSYEYVWHKWDDKTVTKVIIDFAIGC